MNKLKRRAGSARVTRHKLTLPESWSGDEGGRRSGRRGDANAAMTTAESRQQCRRRVLQLVSHPLRFRARDSTFAPSARRDTRRTRHRSAKRVINPKICLLENTFCSRSVSFRFGRISTLIIASVSSAAWLVRLVLSSRALPKVGALRDEQMKTDCLPSLSTDCIFTYQSDINERHERRRECDARVRARAYLSRSSNVLAELVH